MRFINDNYMPTAGTITAPAISIQELQQKLEDADITPTQVLECPEEVNLQNDVKFQGHFEDEAFTDPDDFEDDNALVGYHTLENGFTFLGIAGYGENGCLSPMFTIVYWDGENIRAYTPIRGNCVNADMGSFIGHASSIDLPQQWNNQLFDKLTKTYAQAGLIPNSAKTIDEPEVLEALYLMQFDVIPKTNVTKKGFNFEDWYESTFFDDEGYAREDLAFFNWDGIREGIMAAVQIK